VKLTARRLWLGVTIAIVAWQVVGAFRYPDTLYGTGSAWVCIPGTYYAHSEQEPNGYSYPTEAQIAREASVMSYYGPDRTVEQLRTAAAGKLTKEEFKTVDYFGCTTWFYLIKRIFYGLLWSLLAGIVLLLLRRLAPNLGKEQ
jgi:hypothetical protein